tara:strand:- start:1605 stop:1823 length:219 start_codon:yes stop_codon:yes gene_type:complete
MFKLFNPMNWLILKPTTIGEIVSPEYTCIEKDDAFDKDVRSKAKTYNKTKKNRGQKFKKKRFNKTKFAKKRN